MLLGKQLYATYFAINYSSEKAGGGHLFLFDLVNASLKPQQGIGDVSVVSLTWQPRPPSLRGGGGGGSGRGDSALFWERRKAGPDGVNLAHSTSAAHRGSQMSAQGVQHERGRTGDSSLMKQLLWRKAVNETELCTVSANLEVLICAPEPGENFEGDV